jgi:hypothetical protein
MNNEETIQNQAIKDQDTETETQFSYCRIYSPFPHYFSQFQSLPSDDG